MARDWIKEASQATGISEEKLRSGTRLTPVDEEKYRAWQTEIAATEVLLPALRRTLSGEPNAAVARIAEQVNVPYDVVAEVVRLRNCPSIINFAASKPKLSRDNEHWPEVWNPKRKGGAPLHHLLKSLERAERILDETFEPRDGQSTMAQAIRSLAPVGPELGQWISGVTSLRELVAQVYSIRIYENKKRRLPDWVYFAAGYMNFRECDDEQFHELMLALEPKWNIAEGGWHWNEARKDKNTDWSDPVAALQAFQSRISGSR